MTTLIDYAGSHGMEWEIYNKRSVAKIPLNQLRAIKTIYPKLRRLALLYREAIVENKGFSLTLHFRLVNKNLVKNFKKQIRNTVRPYKKERLLRVSTGKKILEILPNFVWNKGNAALIIWQKENARLKKRLTPIYIGDDTTDEDAFLALKSGITIRVGRKNKSLAKYLVKNIGQVKHFLEIMAFSQKNKNHEPNFKRIS